MIYLHSKRLKIKRLILADGGQNAKLRALRPLRRARNGSAFITFE
jgi:hypothetical protein